MTNDLKRTPLYDAHVKLGGKIVPFAGWELPVQYSGVVAEHVAVREKAGLFDVSHMGEIEVTGPDAIAAVQAMTCNDLSVIVDGQAQYNAIINEKGGVVDDIIVYRYSRERLFICVNASNTDKDFAWFSNELKRYNRFNAKFVNRSAEFGQIAIQGPLAERILSALPGAKEVTSLGYFHFADLSLCNVPVIVARTGYTGEDGFEIFIPWSKTEIIWDALLAEGVSKGLLPAGLGARDSLRLEACYPLHGHELGDNVSAIESGLSWIVKPNKGEFPGRDILAKQKAEGAPYALVGFFLDDAGIARQESLIYSPSGEEIGVTTSGTKTPTIGKALGLARVKKEFSKVGSQFMIQVRDKRLNAHVVERPFYKKPKK